MFHKAIHFILLLSLSLTAVGQMSYRCLDEEPVSRHVCCCDELPDESLQPPCPMEMATQHAAGSCCEVDHEVVSSDGSPWVAAGCGPPIGGDNGDNTAPAALSTTAPTRVADIGSPLLVYRDQPAINGTRTFLHTRRLRL